MLPRVNEDINEEWISDKSRLVGRDLYLECPQPFNGLRPEKAVYEQPRVLIIRGEGLFAGSCALVLIAFHACRKRLSQVYW